MFINRKNRISNNGKPHIFAESRDGMMPSLPASVATPQPRAHQPVPKPPAKPLVVSSNGAGTLACRPVITQELLATYHQLGELASRRNELRDRLLELDAAGAEVERGPYSIMVSEQEHQRVNWKAVQQFLGEGAEAKLRREIEPTVSQYVRVTKCQSH